MNIPALADLLPEPRSAEKACEYKVPILGGWSDSDLRARLRPLDDYLWNPHDSSYYSVALVADTRYPDPVCLMTSDYAAALADHHPTLARHYLDLVIATCGAPRARFIYLCERGFAGDHQLIEPDPAWLTELGEPEDYLGFILDQPPWRDRRS